jgi:hypothetical protein
MRFSKIDILQAFEREDRSYRLGTMCTHWIRDIERYAPNATNLALALNMQAGGRWISYGDLVPALSDPTKREILSSEFLLTYLHTLIRAPFELLSDYCEDFDRESPGQALLEKMKSEPWYGVAYIVRNAVSHNFRIEFGKLRDKIPVSWHTTTITADMEGRPLTPEIFWHRPGYELFLEMQEFATSLPEP